MSKRTDLINAMLSFKGAQNGNAKHQEIIDIYNSQNPLPRGVKMYKTYAWCDATVSSAIIKAGLSSSLPTECSCGKHIELLKKMGAWVENDAFLPEPGDLIFYSWNDKGVGECIEGHDHVGMVYTVVGNTITVMEGNKNGKWDTRTIKVNGRYIRGFAHWNFKDDNKEEYRVAVSGDTITKWVKLYGYDRNFIIEKNNLKFPYWLIKGKKYRVR